MISRVRWEESSLWNMFLRLAQNLPSSKLTLFLSLSLSAVSQAPRARSKARTGGSGLSWVFFNEGPAGTASGKTPRPVESKTAAVLKCKSGCTQRPCNLYFGRPLWQIRASQLESRKLEQTTASVWEEHKLITVLLLCFKPLQHLLRNRQQQKTPSIPHLPPTKTSFIPGQKKRTMLGSGGRVVTGWEMPFLAHRMDRAH